MGHPVTYQSALHGSGELVHMLIRTICPPNLGEHDLLDLGCGTGQITRHLKTRGTTYVDCDDKPEFPRPLIQQDALDFMRGTGRRDIVIGLDVIEHLHRDRGEELLKLVKEKADVAILCTPLGPLMVEPGSSHLSGWYPADFYEAGYDQILFPQYHFPWLNGAVVGEIFAFSRPDSMGFRERLAHAFHEFGDLSFFEVRSSAA